MAPPDKYLLPSARELELLSEAKVHELVKLASEESQRELRYATLGMICGTVSFLGCLASYVVLVLENHDRAAAVVLGTTVLAIVGRMIGGRR